MYVCYIKIIFYVSPVVDESKIVIYKYFSSRNKFLVYIHVVVLFIYYIVRVFSLE